MKTITDSNSRLNNIFKSLKQSIFYRNNHQKIIFIFGCQRSGTTLLSYIFDQLPYSYVFGEYSPLSDKDTYKLRLNPLSEVNKIISKSPAPLIVCKPLVESQRAHALLDYFENAQAIWLYRDYMDVAKSNIVKFGPDEGARNNIRPLCDKDFAKNPWTTWLTEEVQPEMQKIVQQHYSNDMNPNDAAVLFWYLRNEHYFRQNLNNHNRVHLLNYDDLVKAPKDTFLKLFKRMGLNYKVRENSFKNIHSESISKGKHIELSKTISELADDMFKKLHTNCI